MKSITIQSYFSIPTDLAAEMRDWPQFITGEGYSVDLRDEITGGIITVRYIEKDGDGRVVISGPSSNLLDRVVGRVVCAMSAHSDNLLVSK